MNLSLQNTYLVKLNIIISMDWPSFFWPVPKKCLYPKQKGMDRCGAGNQVEGHGQSATLLKVGKPQLGTSKLPLDVCIPLHPQR